MPSRPAVVAHIVMPTIDPKVYHIEKKRRKNGQFSKMGKMLVIHNNSIYL